MARSDTDGLTEKEQSELLRLLEEEQEMTLVLIHSIPRLHYPGQASPVMTADGHYILTLRIASKQP
jgi:hypothetical protein